MSRLVLVLSFAVVFSGNLLQAHPAFEEDDAVRHYRESFDDGYFPFDDDTQPNEAIERRLAAVRHCNLVFADYIRANRTRITLTPPDNPFKVTALVVVANLYKVSEKDQTVTLTTFIELSWRDRRLSNIGGKKCANVTRVLPNLNSIFFPVFTIENSAERVLYNEAWEKFPVAIYGGGVVVWIISLRLVLNCKMNMRTFPYDSQNCYILLRSPHYFQSDLQYFVYNRSTALLLMHEDVRHPLWELNGQMPRLTASNISGIEIWFRLDRKPSFYVWTLIMPTMLVSIATCLPFLLPSSAEEKMQTCLSGILAYFLLLMTMTDVTPQTSEDIPVLTLFYVIIIGIGMFGAAICALIVRLAKYERKQRHKAQQARRAGLKSTKTVPANLNSHGVDDIDEAIRQSVSRHSLNNGGNHIVLDEDFVQVAIPSPRPRIIFVINWRKMFSSKYLNDAFFVMYVSALVVSYIWLITYMKALRAELDVINANTYNYTAVSTFH